MKLIAFILAIFFISTAFAPIFKGHNCADKNQQEQEPSKEGKDCCEGLCLCACCAILFTASPEVEKPTHITDIRKEKDSFPEEQILLTSHSSKTWRPPNV